MNELNNCFEIKGGNSESWADIIDEDETIKAATIVKDEKTNTKIDKNINNRYRFFMESEEEEEEENTTKNVTPLSEDDIIIKNFHKDNNDNWMTISKKNKFRLKNYEFIKCKVCKKDFKFFDDEKIFFESKGWEPRKKCKECKTKNKTNYNSK